MLQIGSLVDGGLDVARRVRLEARGRREAQVDRPAPLGARAARLLFGQPQLHAQLRALAALLLRQERRRRVQPRARLRRRVRRRRYRRRAQLEARRTRRSRQRRRGALARRGHRGGRLHVHSQVRHGRPSPIQSETRTILEIAGCFGGLASGELVLRIFYCSVRLYCILIGVSGSGFRM